MRYYNVIYDIEDVKSLSWRIATFDVQLVSFGNAMFLFAEIRFFGLLYGLKVLFIATVSSVFRVKTSLFSEGLHSVN